VTLQSRKAFMVRLGTFIHDTFLYDYLSQIQSYLDTIGTGSTGTGGLPGKGSPLAGYNTGMYT